MANKHPLRGRSRPLQGRSNLATVKLLGRKKGHEEDAGEPTADAAADSPSRVTRKTDPKGRPTPKRNEARRSTKKGPVAPAPMTASQARARRKSLAGRKLSREERKADKTASRARSTDRRARMMAGEEAYLLPRDQGPARRYVRDVVDSRRSVLGLFMPSALTLLFISIGVPQLQFYMSPAMLVLIAVIGIDGIILGRKVGRMVDAKFPQNTESRLKLGIYAATRASQMRRMRTPKPQVQRGSSVG